MAEAADAAVPEPLLPGLPEKISMDILVRLPPKAVLRCRAVSPAWRRATSARDFLLAHHDRQPSLPIVSGHGEYDDADIDHYGDQGILALDHRAANDQLQLVAQIDNTFSVVASCDGLLVLCEREYMDTFLICNPVTRAHAPLLRLSYSSVLGLYMHRPTGEYRMLLHRRAVRSVRPEGKMGFYVFALGSDQPPRYIQGSDEAAGLRNNTPALVRDSLHWFPVKHENGSRHESGSRLVVVFDTTTELFRTIDSPVARPRYNLYDHLYDDDGTMHRRLLFRYNNVFEMDGVLGIYSCNKPMEVVSIWMLQNYEDEVWNLKYQVKLPVTCIEPQFSCCGGLVCELCCENTEGELYVSIVSVHGGGVLILLSSHGRGRVFYVNTEGQLVGSFHRDGQHIYATELRLKQTLVPHNFFTALEGSDVSDSPFIMDSSSDSE